METISRKTMKHFTVDRWSKMFYDWPCVFGATIFLGHSRSWNYLKVFVILSLSQWDYLKLCKSEWIWHDFSIILSSAHLSSLHAHCPYIYIYIYIFMKAMNRKIKQNQGLTYSRFMMQHKHLSLQVNMIPMRSKHIFIFLWEFSAAIMFILCLLNPRPNQETRDGGNIDRNNNWIIFTWDIIN